MCLMSNKGVDTWRLTEAVFEIEEIGKVPSSSGPASLTIRDVVVLLHLYTVAMSMEKKKPLCQDYMGN